MFESAFFESVLPDRIRQRCVEQSGHVPVVELHLADGDSLDLCHIVHLADRWLLVAFYRDPAKCSDMDLAFLGYDTIKRITVSMHDPHSRRLGFNLEAGVKSPVTTGSSQ